MPTATSLVGAISGVDTPSVLASVDAGPNTTPQIPSTLAPTIPVGGTQSVAISAPAVRWYRLSARYSRRSSICRCSVQHHNARQRNARQRNA
jgi:hypothetical protein